MSTSTDRMRAMRQRDRAHRKRFVVEANPHRLAEALVDEYLLSEWDANDHKKIATALQLMVDTFIIHKLGPEE